MLWHIYNVQTADLQMWNNTQRQWDAINATVVDLVALIGLTMQFVQRAAGVEKLTAITQNAGIAMVLGERHNGGVRAKS